MKAQLKNFFDGMAKQFLAGLEIIEPLNNALCKERYSEAKDAIHRDILSFAAEAHTAFPKHFNREEFLTSVGL